MKRIFNISLFALLSMAFVGCENVDDFGDNGGNSVDIEIPMDADYITFMTDVKSRAVLETSDYIEESFGVISYTYHSSNSWGAYKVHATPNVNALGEDQDYPTKVTHNAGTYSYGDAAAWEPDTKYAFFAYHPYDHDYVTPSSEEIEGTPYVTYNLHLTDATEHADVITGYAANCYASLSKYVQFRMNHRLAAVDVAAVNYYDYSSDSDGDGVYTTENVNIEIQSMTATFSNLKYGSATIYLDRAIPIEPTSISGTPKYSVVSEDGYNLKPSTSTAFDYISVAENTTMLFIPQAYVPSELLTVEIEVKYKKKTAVGEEYLWTVVETVEEVENDKTVLKEYKVDIPAGSSDAYIDSIDPNDTVEGDITVEGRYTDNVFTTIQTATFDQELKEENRYYALLTFTSHAVSINILTAAAWNENSIDYEFD